MIESNSRKNLLDRDTDPLRDGGLEIRRYQYKSELILSTGVCHDPVPNQPVLSLHIRRYHSRRGHQ